MHAVVDPRGQRGCLPYLSLEVRGHVRHANGRRYRPPTSDMLASPRRANFAVTAAVVCAKKSGRHGKIIMHDTNINVVYTRTRMPGRNTYLVPGTRYNIYMCSFVHIHIYTRYNIIVIYHSPSVAGGWVGGCVDFPRYPNSTIYMKSKRYHLTYLRPPRRIPPGHLFGNTRVATSQPPWESNPPPRLSLPVLYDLFYYFSDVIDTLKYNCIPHAYIPVQKGRT